MGWPGAAIAQTRPALSPKSEPPVGPVIWNRGNEKGLATHTGTDTPARRLPSDPGFTLKPTITKSASATSLAVTVVSSSTETT